jgi:hypothetical protein
MLILFSCITFKMLNSIYYGKGIKEYFTSVNENDNHSQR